MSSGDPVERRQVDDLVELVRQAGRLTLRWFATRDLAIDRKGDGSPVTDADRAAEQFIRAELARRHPEDAIIGEELGPQAGRSGRTWIIDPIDGTEAFIRGVPLFTNLVAMIDRDGPAIGVVNAPALDEYVAAGRGVGCHSSAGRAQVSAVEQLDEACISSSGYETSWWPPAVLDAVAGCGSRIRAWGDGYGYLLLATGRVDAMIEPAIRVWDVAPMQVIIPEAGGRLTNWDGDEWPDGSDTGSVLATNGRLHPALLDVLSGRR